MLHEEWFIFWKILRCRYRNYREVTVWQIGQKGTPSWSGQIAVSIVDVFQNGVILFSQYQTEDYWWRNPNV